MQAIIFFFQHLPFNLAGGEQDLQEHGEVLPLIASLPEPPNGGWGVSSPLIDSNRWPNQRGRAFLLTPCPDEQHWRASNGFIKYSLPTTTRRTLGAHRQKKRPNKRCNESATVQTCERSRAISKEKDFHLILEPFKISNSQQQWLPYSWISLTSLTYIKYSCLT